MSHFLSLLYGTQGDGFISELAVTRRADPFKECLLYLSPAKNSFLFGTRKLNHTFPTGSQSIFMFFVPCSMFVTFMDLMVARGIEEVGDLVAVLHQEYGLVNIV